MPTKQELEALKSRSDQENLSEQAIWINDKLNQDHVPALNLLEARSGATEASLAEAISNVIPAINLLETRSVQSVEGLAALIDNAVSALNLLDDRSSKKAAAITTADATDLASAITLLNEIKTKLNLMNA